MRSTPSTSGIYATDIYIYIYIYIYIIIIIIIIIRKNYKNGFELGFGISDTKSIASCVSTARRSVLNFARRN